MNEPVQQSPGQPAGGKPAAVIAPNLSAQLRENYDAVEEDLRQANDLTAELEPQLAGKSKEVLHLKFLFQQTKAHLGHMQDSIVAMRKERHKLANDAMRAMRLEMTVGVVTAERDRLKAELEGVLEGLALENAKKALTFDKRDHHIAELTFELMKLRQELAELRRTNPPAVPRVPEPQRPMPLKTSAGGDAWSEAEMEIIPTERVPGGRGKA
jgi:septal ring factor EnvC (AmiA/AmiB activator)